jgi:hypothetical protein
MEYIMEVELEMERREMLRKNIVSENCALDGKDSPE